MLCLPIELFARICETLAVSDIMSVTGTCRDLRKVRQGGYIPALTLYANAVKHPRRHAMLGRATHIRARKCGTRRLIGIMAEYAGYIASLHLRKVLIPNIAIVAPCVNLQILNISGMDIYSVAGLNTCRSLQVFKASRTSIEDISALSGLPALHTVIMTSSALAALPRLDAVRKLHIANTRVGDISSLAYATGLQNLDIVQTDVSDIAVLAALPIRKLKHSAAVHTAQQFSRPTLAKLAVCGQTLLPLPLYSIRDLRVCANLWKVVVKNALITDIGVLAECPHIRTLNIGYTRVTTVPVLPRLCKLIAHGCPLTDIENVGYAVGLVYLDVSQTGLQSLAGLEKCTVLETLVATNNQIREIDTLRALTRLKYCDIGHNYCRDLSPLQTCCNIRHLDITGNMVNTLEVVVHLAGLETLKVGGTRIYDINALQNCENLQYADISWTSVYELEPLRHCKKMHTLLVRGCPIADHTISDHIYNTMLPH